MLGIQVAVRLYLSPPKMLAVCPSAAVWSAMGAPATILTFAILMVVLPLGTLLATTQGRLDALLQPLLGQEVLDTQRTVIAGVLGVLAVNLTLVLFVATAWAERPLPPKDTKRD